MKPITIIIAVLLLVAVVGGVAFKISGAGDGGSSKGGNSARAERERSIRQGTPTPTLVPPTRKPTPIRSSSSGGAKATIRLSDEQYESIRLNNAIARFVIEHGFGYPTEIVVTTTQEMQDLIVSGDIDLEMEGWQHNRLIWYDDAVRNQQIENLGQTYESGPQFFMIPQWMADEYGIRSIDDMKEHWQLVQDPTDKTRGSFLNCPIGSACAKVNSVKLEAYGLSGYFNLRTPSDLNELEEWLEAAQESRQPVFSYYWKPAKLNAIYEWQILEEPAYTEECWDQVRLASEDKIPRPIAQACEYPDFPIDKLAHAGLRKKAPDVTKMLERMDMGLEPLAEIIGWAKENGIDDVEQMAIRYLETHADRYRSWMPDENYIKVQKKVRERRGY